MNVEKIGPGNNAPEEINVVIEIPTQSDPVKYEHDKDTGAMVVDRFMATAMYYPCNYGYVPQTLSEDGDPEILSAPDFDEPAETDAIGEGATDPEEPEDGSAASPDSPPTDESPTEE